MPYCPKCGVKLDESVKECPLCFTTINNIERKDDISKKNEQKKYTESYPDYVEPNNKLYKDFSGKHKEKLLYFLLTFSLLFPVIFTVTRDIISNKAVTWSMWVMIPLLTIWVITTLFIVLNKTKKEIFNIISFILLSASIFFVAIDILISGFNNGLSWSLIADSVILPTVIFLFYLGHIKKRGLNLIGFFLICALILIILLDLFIDYNLSWSLTIMSILIPIIILIYIIHFTFLKNSDLKKIFHI